MKVVQTRLPESEYDLLRHRAAEEHKAMQEVLREALRLYLLPDTVDPQDPIFHVFPLGKSLRGKHNLSEDHDKVLYGKVR